MAEVELPDIEELEERKRDEFGKRIALVTAFFAVALAITSLGGNNATKEMMLAQQQVSNQWAHYQSKTIREHLYRAERIHLEGERAGRTTGPAAQALAQLDAEEKRFGAEKKEIERESKRLESVRDLQMAKDPYFDYAEVLLQIAIVLSSISILATSRRVFVVACVAAALGSLLSLNGFFLLVRLPFFS